MKYFMIYTKLLYNKKRTTGLRGLYIIVECFYWNTYKINEHVIIIKSTSSYYQNILVINEIFIGNRFSLRFIVIPNVSLFNFN